MRWALSESLRVSSNTKPISRDHPGLVNILHVGRSADSDEGVFYYYVMELGDDINPGEDSNPVEYEPRNLRMDMKRANGIPMDPDVVIAVGLRLAEALKYLHDKGTGSQGYQAFKHYLCRWQGEAC